MVLLNRRGTTLKEKAVSDTRSLLSRLDGIAVPYAWFKTVRNHTAILLLADILSAYSGQEGDRASLWDGDEMLLEYKHIAARLRVNARSISRAIKLLEKLKALRPSRRDRKVNGKPTRNVVGVVPNLEVIAKLSGVALGDILSAQGTATAPPRRGNRIPMATARPTAEPVPLTDFRESLVRAYKDIFNQSVGEDYQTSSDQQLADLRAVASVTIPTVRGAGRAYMVWARQYLEALKDKAEQEVGEASEAAYNWQGFVKERYTIESFIAWAKTQEVLPNGFARQSFQ